MRYIKLEVPVTLGRVVDQSTHFLGIDVKENQGNFVLYDVQNGTLIETFDKSEFDFEIYGDPDEFPLSKGFSGNGAYFVADYELDEDDEITCCYIKVYNQDSLKQIATIPISEIHHSWLEDCRMAEAAKLTEEDYLLIYYDHAEGMNAVVEACHYNTKVKRFNILSRMEIEDAQWRNIFFDCNWMTLCMDSFSDYAQNYMTEQDGGTTYRFRLSNDFCSLTDIEDLPSNVLNFDERAEGVGKRIRRYSIGVELQNGRKGLLGKEYYKLVDTATGEELLDLTTNRNQSEWYEVLQALNLVVAGVEDYKNDTQKIYVFEKKMGRIEKVDEFDVDIFASHSYDKRNRFFQIESMDKTTLITTE